MLLVFRNKHNLDMFERQDSHFYNSLISVCRTSDGGKVVGTIEVIVVKMGEIEDGEADHITTDVQGQKVDSLSALCTN